MAHQQHEPAAVHRLRAIPQIGDEFAVWGGSHQLALHSEDPAIQAAAGCWMSWFLENSLDWAAAGQIPAYTPARDSPELATQAPGIAAIAPSAAEGVVILPQVAGWKAPCGLRASSLQSTRSCSVRRPTSRPRSIVRTNPRNRSSTRTPRPMGGAS